LFPALEFAASTFEQKALRKFLTEPDIRLYVPGPVARPLEAKFTSGNTIASASATHDVINEKTEVA